MSWKPLLLVPLVSCFVHRPAVAQQNAEQNATPPSSQDFSKEAYVIEHLSTKIRAEGDGTGTKEVVAEVRMVADAGVKAFAVLKFTYTSANESVDLDYVRVRKPDGTVVKTPDYNIQDMPGEVTRAAPLYSDIHEKHVAIKGLGVGDTLEYLVRFRVLKPQVPGQFWHEYYFTKDAIARDERLEISVPIEKYVKVVSPEFKPGTTQEGSRRVYSWKHSNLVAQIRDPDELPRRTLPDPDVQLTTFATWEEVGRWYAGLQKDSLEITPEIQARAFELTSRLKSDDEKIHAVYNFVSLKFHYIGLDFGIGRYQPHAAGDVLDNGYGDCKDKHTLMASLLKAAGIEAWPALIHSSRKLNIDVPSPAQFNHVITVVPTGGQLTWLDTTPEVAPFGLLLLGLRDKQALVIPANKPPVVMTTPQNTSFAQEQEFSMKGKLDAHGTFTGHVEQSYRSDSEVFLRTLFRQVPQSQWKEAAQRFSYGMNFGGEVSNVNVTAPEDLDKAFELSYDYVRKKYGSWDERQVTAPLPPMGIEVMKDAKEKKPVEPLLLGGLGKVTYRSRLELPPGYEAVAPQSVHLNEPYAEFTDDTRIENGVMTTTRVLVIKKTEVALSEWESFRKFGRAVADDEFNMLQLRRSSATKAGKAGEDETEEAAEAMDKNEVFREGATAAQRGDLGRAQELFEKVIKEDPNYQGAHSALGAVLLSRGDIDEGLKQFGKEQELSPQEERNYQVPATILVQMGRKDEAIEQWRKLLKADPNNRMASSRVGELLVETGKYSDAATVLETAVKAAPDNANLQLELGQVYLKTGEKEKAIACIRKGAEQKSGDPMALNNVAYTLAENNVSLDLAQQYGQKAVDELDDRARSAPSDEAGMRVTYQLSLVWDTLGWVYFQQGDLNRAEGLVRPAWLLSQESVVGEHLGEIYEKQGKRKEAARLYHLALAALSGPGVASAGSSAADRIEYHQKRTNELTARYQKLTGKKPVNESIRLPNGGWSPTPDEQLRQMREVKISNERKIAGSADFVIVFEANKVESVRMVSGAHALDQFGDKLRAAHYQVEFPPERAAILVRKLELRCSPTGPCVATLIQAGRAQVQSPYLAR